MTYKYTIQGENGRVGGSNKDYDWILKEEEVELDLTDMCEMFQS